MIRYLDIIRATEIEFLAYNELTTTLHNFLHMSISTMLVVKGNMKNEEKQFSLRI